MPNPQLNLPQQFGRFLITGTLVFIMAFWGTSMIFLSAQDAHRDLSVVRMIFKSSIHQPFTTWFHDLESAYIPFFLRQLPLMACYLISATFAWLAAFVFDGRILRKENAL